MANRQASPSDVSNVKKPSGLDLFFQSIENEKTNQEPTKANSVRTITSEELNVINPLTDEKLSKLKTSTDNLRKALQFDTFNNTSSLEEKRLHHIKRNIAARKIQKWYKTKKEKYRQDELQKLFSDKRNEMRKKMEKNLEKSSIFNKKQTKTSFNLEKPKPKVNDSIKKPDESIKTSFMSDSTIKETARGEERPKNPAQYKDSTVESLLMDLEKIDRESETLFKMNESETMNSSVKDEKVSSILSFLDEASNKGKVSFTPRVFKDFNDYKFEEEVIQQPIKSAKADVKKMSESAPKGRKNSINEISSTNKVSGALFFELN